ncbi:hypothetical protein AAFF_G00440430 [Aldrovandia affinis]|uniref:Uncharacterized protein n=1 Tax=Aldrovandia affinis TaxID=143900 RepID=A0AAD7S783_9TELE|nr:hypothetical protein AAFF_G00440430 [Aldrovandia affinis]
MLWDEVKRKLASLRRAEHIRKRRKRKEKERDNFFKNPFKHAKQLLEDKKSVKLEVTKEKLKQHIRGQYSHSARNNPLGPPGHVPCPAPPTSQFNITLPKFCEVREVVKKPRKGVRNDNTIFVTGHFGRNMLQLPLQPISLGYKQGKTRLVQELRESTDQLVRCADAQVRTGRKWKAQVEVDQAISRLQHLEVVGRVQAG